MTNPERREKIREILEDCFWHEMPSNGTCKYHLKFGDALSALEALMPEMMGEEEIARVLARKGCNLEVAKEVIPALTIAKPTDETNRLSLKIDILTRDNKNLFKVLEVAHQKEMSMLKMIDELKAKPQVMDLDKILPQRKKVRGGNNMVKQGWKVSGYNKCLDDCRKALANMPKVMSQEEVFNRILKHKYPNGFPLLPQRFVSLKEVYKEDWDLASKLCVRKGEK